MQRRIILLVILLAIAGAGYYFGIYATKQPITAWGLVPNSALAVYETDQPYRAWYKGSNKSFFSALSATAFFREMKESVTFLSNQASDSLALKKAFANQQVLISLHKRSSSQFGYLFLVEDNAGQLQNLLGETIKSLLDSGSFTLQERNYRSKVIREFVNQNSEPVFSYIKHEGVLAGSFDSFLVEDAIRLITGKKEFKFRQIHKQFGTMPSLSNDFGNLYVNTQSLPELFSVFTEQQSVNALKFFCSALYYDVNITDEQLALSGFSNRASDSVTTYLDTFAGQRPGQFSLERLIPNRTAVLYHVHLNNPLAWRAALSSYQRREGDLSVPVSEKIASNDLEEYLQMFTAELSGEAAYAILESVNTESPDKLLILGIEDSTGISNSLQLMNEAVSGRRSSSFSEQFGNYLLQGMEMNDFPRALLGHDITGFRDCYYLYTDQHLVIANTVLGLKSFIKDLETDNTWARSVKQTIFMEDLIKESNFNVFFTIPYAIEYLQPRLNESWQAIFNQYFPELRQYDRMALQFSNVDDLVYSNLVVHKDNGARPVARRSGAKIRQLARMEKNSITRPYLVTNHVDNTTETVLQDEDYNLYLFGAEGELLWKDSIGQPVISEIMQVDFYRNGKLQLFFATPGAIHIIDRNGNPVEGYPLYVEEESDIFFLSLVDYDNSKRYRFLTADREGRLKIYNKARENLEGWTPRSIGGTPSSPPFHFRLLGKDYIVALQKNGMLNLLKRSGRQYPGFPIEVGGKTTSPVFINYGNSFGNTGITFIREDGLLYEINLKGEVLRQNQYFRPNPYARFQLVSSVNAKNYLIAVNTRNSIQVLNEEGEELINSSFISPAALENNAYSVQYYTFSPGKALIIITDKVQSFSYLYSADGELIFNRPVASNFEPSVFMNGNSVVIRKTYNGEVAAFTLENY